MKFYMYPEMNYCNIIMENGVETINKLMSMLQDAEIEIQKYYWRSKYDETYLELKRPIITDAFLFHLDLTGNTDKIKSVLEDYCKISKTYKHLDKCLHTLNKQEIQNIADDFIKVL